MTRQDHLLTIAVEECMETGQRITKALRFGMDEVQPEQDMNNAQRIMQEYVDLVTVMGMIAKENKDFGAIFCDAEQLMKWAETKRKKVERFLEYSSDQGRLDK